MTEGNLISDNQVTDENVVRITLEGRDEKIPFDTLGIDMDSSESEILTAVRGVIGEISDDLGEFSYTTRKALNSSTIYVYPKPVAGTW